MARRKNRSPGLAIQRLRASPHFPWVETGLSRHLPTRGSKKERGEKDVLGFCGRYYTAVTDGYVFPRGQSQSSCFGRMDFILRYFRRLFITVVSYCRARQRSVSKKRLHVFVGLENKTETFLKSIDFQVVGDIVDFQCQATKMNYATWNITSIIFASLSCVNILAWLQSPHNNPPSPYSIGVIYHNKI